MAFDEHLGDRKHQYLQSKNVSFYDKKIMGELVFMVDNKMCCGIHIDKKYDDSLFMEKIGVEAYEKEIHKDICLPMDFTGRLMKGYIFIIPNDFDLETDLEYWIDTAIDYNKTTAE